ncbi:TPA: group II intron reverse transcriptase/maturase, partial [Enterococcus faecium]|nr:group II intron reverse transcriptase/maturase [Enterococcus faecium]HAP9572042.1 group II intron reverse transcriptase/maturase [Enterococcus faecium]HAQ0334583.1 group II intron reverse transcriptase/maturase [Enterococcus faecium]HAQ0543582.1 group II intron reverse transcriptase/maturase [Enterococcus faecium]HAQ0575830.1 group II intron reverse transcriptase/maturase [Enterococcus faecium]
IARELRPSFEIRLREQGISKEGQYGKYEGYKPYLRSGQIRYIRGFPILPVGYIQHRHPMCKKRNINKYTEEGREAIHKKQQTVEEWKISWLCSNPVLSKRATIEFADNRISKFIAQKGRCAVTGEELILSEMHCHHIIPYHESKSDSYENLVIVTEEVHRVIHATQSETIEELLKYLKLNPKQKEKLNELRLKVGNEEIS